MHRSGKSAADLESFRQRLREDSFALDVVARRVDVPSDSRTTELWATARPRGAGKSLRGPSMICGHRARVATGMASPRHRVIQPFAAEGARLDELDAGGAATASRRRFLPQLSGHPISACGVVYPHLCARRAAMTSSSSHSNLSQRS